jgi:GrpB-like predicted nucleotidyltransferase (UPF0157 family)
MPGLVPHDPAWPDAYAAEAVALSAQLGPLLIALYHVGSTSVVGLPAKPIIDILGIVADQGQLGADSLAALGYEGLGEFGIAGRRYFRRTNAAGVRTHHLHLFGPGAPEIARHLAFRDYLRAHPDRAQAYAERKMKLAGAVDYQRAKAPIVAQLLAEALAWQAGR